VSWHPNDLVTDDDLVSYERDILAGQGATEWQARRTKALEDWLFPLLQGRGFDPHRLRTRYEADALYSYTASTFGDLTSASRDLTADDLDLAAVFATVGTDALYVGSVKPFRGVFVRMLDSVSSTASTLTVSYWSGAWEPITIANGTAIGSKTFATGGAVSWQMPSDWSTRAVNGSEQLYWVKLTVSATPASAKATQVGVIRASALRAPATFRTLQLIFQEAKTGADGPWDEKATFYREEAEAALSRVMPIIGGEFDTDKSDQVSEAESEQTAEQAGGGDFRWERA
jgi:hypothetical protein